jgi:hypothetical protein
VAASVRKMSNQDADDCAALIVEIFGMMSRRQTEPTRANTVVQLQAVERTASEYEISALVARN